MAAFGNAGAQTNSASDFTIDLGENYESIIITGYKGASTKVVIAAEYDGIPVRAIGKDAFRDNKNITSVVIPKSVTSIKSEAFRYCSSLTTVTIEDGAQIRFDMMNVFGPHSLSVASVIALKKAGYTGNF
jgi:hypothetical protein